MAKKSKAGGAKPDKKAEKKKAPREQSPQEKAEEALLLRVEEAYERGSYQGVQRLAAEAGSVSDATRAVLDERVAQTKVDPVQLAVGGFGIFAVLVAAVLTLS